jgi:hypothetical protein
MTSLIRNLKLIDDYCSKPARLLDDVSDEIGYRYIYLFPSSSDLSQCPERRHLAVFSTCLSSDEYDGLPSVNLDNGFFHSLKQKQKLKKRGETLCIGLTMNCRLRVKE